MFCGIIALRETKKLFELLVTWDVSGHFCCKVLGTYNGTYHHGSTKYDDTGKVVHCEKLNWKAIKGKADQVYAEGIESNKRKLFLRWDDKVVWSLNIKMDCVYGSLIADKLKVTFWFIQHLVAILSFFLEGFSFKPFIDW